jgi:cystathionine beta-lyase
MAGDKNSERTRLVHLGRPEKKGRRSVNPPVVRASTVLYESTSDLRETRRRRAQGERVFAYGTGGTPTTFALEDVIAELEGGYRTRLAPSGLAAIALAIQAYVRPGDHVLITDAVYEPVRRMTKAFMEPFGIGYEYYAADGSDLEGRIKPNTRLVFAEVPGSLAFEMCDLRKIASLTKPRGITLAVDNTWACGYLYKPLQHGADCSILAATKHIVGHADVLLGTVTTTKDAWDPVNDIAGALGYCISSDDAYLALRGARTMAARLPVHEQTAR